MRKYLLNIIKYGLLSCLLLLLTEQATAQFTITDNFRGSASPGIVTGDGAKFTSGQEDPVNAGWLRLTNDQQNQKGYAYVNRSFPSTLGVIVDFEYIMWRTRNDETYQGADGLSVFLFDAQYGPGNFRLGAYGGSLGYANSTAAIPPTGGVTGGYVGIGLDAYGNFARRSEGKNGGPTPNLSPNSIIMRGPTTSTSPNDNSTNRYLKGVTILNNANGAIVDAMNPQGNARHDVIDYNTVTSTRPTQEQFYRRVLIEIYPTGTGLYDISIKWATTFGGELRDLMTYQTADVPPELLKVGFAASTGSGYNNHEVRNLLITTPGNLRVVKRANKDLLRSIYSATGPSNEIEYHIEVINDTPAELDAIDFKDKLTDAHGNPLPAGLFEITSITPIGFLANTTLPNPSETSPITTGEFEGTLHLAAKATGVIRVKGKLNAMPSGNLLVNTTSAFPTTIIDQDLLNNTSVVETPVVSEKSDLVIRSEVDESCLKTDGNNFELTVSNIGVLPLQYGQDPNTQLKVTTMLPTGVDISGLSHAGWAHTSSGNQHTFTRNGSGTLTSGQSLPSIKYTLSSATGSGYTNEVSVSSTMEPEENTHNNTAKKVVDSTPDAPEAVETVYYCLGETAVPLEANAAPGHTLQWYLNEGGAVSNTAFTPSTSSVGNRSYYVSQRAEGGCESGLTEIQVIVLEEPTHGSISGDQEICGNTMPEKILSTELGIVDAASTVSYKWESSIDEGQTWTEISAAVDADYQPMALKQTTFFRRITVATVGDGETICESVPTNVVKIDVKDCHLITNPMIYQRVK